jgi:hypothetical protein
MRAALLTAQKSGFNTESQPRRTPTTSVNQLACEKVPESFATQAHTKPYGWRTRLSRRTFHPHIGDLKTNVPKYIKCFSRMSNMLSYYDSSLIQQPLL